MGRRMIFHVIFAIIGAFAYYLFFDAVLISDAIIFAIIYLVFSFLLDFIRNKIRSKKNKTQVNSIDHAKVKAFIEAVGGTENITSTDSESSRVKVVIKDVDLIDQDKLKELALDGAYLAGDQLQMTIGESSGEFSRQIREAIG